MDFQVFLICVSFSIVLMLLFVLINYPYYSLSYGSRSRSIILRTVLLNTAAIAVGWIPAVNFWPDFSKTVLLPAVCAIGTLSCVGSRFIYHEIVPEELGKTLLRIIERKREQESNS